VHLRWLLTRDNTSADSVSLARGVRAAQARVYAGAMADLVDRIRRELERRSKRARPVVGELQRLQRAVGVIVSTTRSQGARPGDRRVRGEQAGGQRGGQ
jgi:hypothetical protein